MHLCEVILIGVKKPLINLSKSLLIVLGLMLMVLLYHVVRGKFQVDNTLGPPDFGLYDSAFRGSGAYLNPLWSSLLVVEVFAFPLLAVVLIIFHKVLHMPIIPWLLFMALIPLGFYAAHSWINRAYPFDDSVNSTFPWFRDIELVALGVIIVSQSMYYGLVRKISIKIRP